PTGRDSLGRIALHRFRISPRWGLPAINHDPQGWRPGLSNLAPLGLIRRLRCHLFFQHEFQYLALESKENPPAMPSIVFTILVLLSLAVPLEAGTRIALVTTEASPETDQIIVLAEAELGSDEGLELLDRQDVLKVLGEHKLALSGMVDPEQAIKA